MENRESFLYLPSIQQEGKSKRLKTNNQKCQKESQGARIIKEIFSELWHEFSTQKSSLKRCAQQRGKKPTVRHTTVNSEYQRYREDSINFQRKKKKEGQSQQISQQQSFGIQWTMDQCLRCAPLCPLFYIKLNCSSPLICSPWGRRVGHD